MDASKQAYLICDVWDEEPSGIVVVESAKVEAEVTAKLGDWRKDARRGFFGGAATMQDTETHLSTWRRKWRGQGMLLDIAWPMGRLDILPVPRGTEPTAKEWLRAVEVLRERQIAERDARIDLEIKKALNVMPVMPRRVIDAVAQLVWRDLSSYNHPAQAEFDARNRAEAVGQRIMEMADFAGSEEVSSALKSMDSTADKWVWAINWQIKYGTETPVKTIMGEVIAALEEK